MTKWLDLAGVLAALWILPGCIAPDGAQQAAVGLTAKPVSIGDVQDAAVSQAGPAVQSGGDVKIGGNGGVAYILAIGLVVILFGYAIGKTVNRLLVWLIPKRVLNRSKT